MAKEELRKLIIYHKHIHPFFMVQDVYKLIYQATMGPQHIMNIREDAYSSLRAEFQKVKLDSVKGDSLLENVSIDGKVSRVNLRPYSKKFNDIEMLFNVMETSVKNFQPNRTKLIELWEEFKVLVHQGELDFDYKEVLSFDRVIEMNRDVSIKHSEVYRKEEKPSYRVVLKKFFERALLNSK